MRSSFDMFRPFSSLDDKTVSLAFLLSSLCAEKRVLRGEFTGRSSSPLADSKSDRESFSSCGVPGEDRRSFGVFSEEAGEGENAKASKEIEGKEEEDSDEGEEEEAVVKPGAAGEEEGSREVRTKEEEERMYVQRREAQKSTEQENLTRE